eukprot:756587-Hanusia_phi.AAC.2
MRKNLLENLLHCQVVGAHEERDSAVLLMIPQDRMAQLRWRGQALEYQVASPRTVFKKSSN